MGYSDPQRQRDYLRQWAARRRASWMAGRVCAVCGGERNLSAHHATVSTKSIWTRRAEYRAPILAEAVVLCRRCRMKPGVLESSLATEALEWCPVREVWCDGAAAARRVVERLAA